MSLWYRIVKNIPDADNIIKPIEYSLKPHTVHLKFIYCYDELVLKIDEHTQDCICYFNQKYEKGNLLDSTFLIKIYNLIKIYFTKYYFDH